MLYYDRFCENLKKSKASLYKPTFIQGKVKYLSYVLSLFSLQKSQRSGKLTSRRLVQFFEYWFLEISSKYSINTQITQSKEIFKFQLSALAGVTQGIEHRPAIQKVPGSFPGQGTCLGCRPVPSQGVSEATYRCFSYTLIFSSSLFISLPLSIQIDRLKSFLKFNKFQKPATLRLMGVVTF